MSSSRARRRLLRAVLGGALLGFPSAAAIARIVPPHAANSPAPNTATVPMHADSRATITLTPITGITQGRGFLPVRIRIENRFRETQRWRVDFSYLSYERGQTTCNSAFAIEAAAGTAGETVVFVPLAFDGANRSGFGYTQLSATVSGPDATGFPTGILGGGAIGNRHIAASRSLEARIQDMLREQEKTLPRSGPRGPPAQQADYLWEPTMVDIAAWPADWRVWSVFSAVVLEESEWEQLDNARRAALLDWAATGGQLLLFPRGPRSEDRERWSAGAVWRLAQPLAATGRAELARLLDEADAAAVNVRRWPGASTLNDPKDPLTQPFRAGGWLIGFVICFAILAGPVNLYWFAPAGKRHRLFLTVPALSLGGTLALWIAILIGDGIGGHGARQAVVTLLPGENRAMVFQQQLVRTGAIASGDFRLRPDTAMAVLTEPGVRTLQTSFAREGEQASGDWFTNRSILRHELLRIEPTRARVELVGGGKGAPPVVQSSLGTTLRDFEYVDDMGRRWLAAEVPPGRRVTLAPPNRELTFSYAEPTRRGQFRALGGASDLAPIPTHGSIRWEDRSILYTGRLEAAQP